MEVSERREWVKTSQRCFNCLGDTHKVFQCKSNGRCYICNRKHHTLLHSELNASNQGKSSVDVKGHTSVTDAVVDNSVCATTATNAIKEGTNRQTLLPTASVVVVVGNRKVPCRILLDSGAQASFITEACAQLLNVKRQNARMAVSGIGTAGSETTRGKVRLQLETVQAELPYLFVEAYVLAKVTSKLPATPINKMELETLDLMGIPLADPHYDQPGQIDMILGAEHFFKTLKPEQIRSNSNNIILHNTIFGWVISGPTTSQPIEVYCATTLGDSDVSIDETLRKFWEMENVESKHLLSEEEEICEEHFTKNLSRAVDGKFMVRLPFKDDESKLGESLPIAIRRLQGVEKRFARDETLRQEYKKFLHEYQSLGHMKEITPHEKSHDGVYLPHHGVVSQSSTTTKLRVVFDASAKTSTGVSLNDCLAVGPTVQSKLMKVLLRFRERCIVFVADVEKMYRQIWIHPEERKFQRIVWRDDPDKPIRHFELLTVTYGTSSAPFLATRILKEIGLRHCHSNPTVATAILEDFYVDDLLSGAHSIEEAVELKDGIDAALKEAGLCLRKWISNSSKLENEETLNESVSITDIKENTKVLGLQWNPKEDTFRFKVNIEVPVKLTKRIVLSNAGKIFDPLGLLAPIIIQIKIFIQHLWLANANWDDILDETLSRKWAEICKNLKLVEKLSIGRFIHSTKGSTVSLHGFCDASENAYAAVIYFKVITAKNEKYVELITSKTKVAPIKKISIPRLELCGALLLAKLMASVLQHTSLHVSEIHAWTDSNIVLDWLSSSPQRWKTFVANRTSEILEIVSRQKWKYVPSAENPADCASRGLSPQQLKTFELWWNGPTWLKEESNLWPVKKHMINPLPAEMRSLAMSITAEPSFMETLASRYSTYNKVVRVVGYLYRFFTNVRRPKGSRNNSKLFSKEEIWKATNIIIRQIQITHFSAEIKSMQQGGAVSTLSALKTLNPFFDQNQVLRVGGRLSNSTAKFGTKHPLIVPNQSTLAKRIVEDAHREQKHAGASLLLATIRQKYWILGAKRIIKGVIHKCVICTKMRAKLQTQVMGDLPAARAEYIRPFLKVGVDFAGPIPIHLTKGRGKKTYKAYVCLFICLSIKAVHIELVGDMSSDSFLAALKRFISRRGVCSDIYSDNGTNFVGANNLLKANFSKLVEESNECSNFFSRKIITWHFNPPSAPHFGGLWEAAIKSAKFHLKRVIGDTILTMEEMSTVLSEIEAILNSRPLCILSANELDILTPSHFLIGHPHNKIPEPSLPDKQYSFRKRWQMVQKLSQQFWKRWHLEYLTSLQQRAKWNERKSNVKPGDIVIIKDDNLPPTQWRLGRVTQCHVGEDKLVRVVTLQTKSGTMQRPITKVCILPVESDDSRWPLCWDPHEQAHVNMRGN